MNRRAILVGALIVSAGGCVADTSEQSTMTATFESYAGPTDDVAADASKARSTVRFGPIEETAMTTQVVLSVSEQHDGSASRTLNYQARKGLSAVQVHVDSDLLDRGPFDIGVDLLGEVTIIDDQAHRSWSAQRGTVELRSEADEIVIELRAIDLVASLEPSNVLLDLDGRVRGKPVRVCTYLDRNDPTAPRQNGIPAPQPRLDPEWSSAFCAAQREPVEP